MGPRVSTGEAAQTCWPPSRGSLTSRPWSIPSWVSSEAASAPSWSAIAEARTYFGFFDTFAFVDFFDTFAFVDFFDTFAFVDFFAEGVAGFASADSVRLVRARSKLDKVSRR